MLIKNPLSYLCALLIGPGSALAAEDNPLAKATRMLSPEESMATMQIAEGYSIELVASEPVIEEPVLVVWDGNGAMYVAEMRTYMQDIDGKDQFRPISRVVRLVDSNGDGRYDKHTTFIDGLVLPRMVLPLDDRIVVRETHTLDLYSYRDTDGDGVADEKTLIHQGGRRGGNLEHQPSGLIWNIDNWIYTTYSRHRYRYKDGVFIREPLPHGSGQWGLSQDDYGRIFYCTAGGENPAMDFQQPIRYGRISLPGEQAPGFREVFPIDNIPDVQGGRGRLRANNTLNHFTGCAGQSIYRGDRMPDDFYGNLIVPEPVGRLVRRAVVKHVDGKVVVDNYYDKKEFIASTDANFRPLNSATGPDGSLYLVDMYRGIIQEGNWVRPGSFLRPVVEKYELDKNIGRGRIYRIRHKDFKPNTEQPRMLGESPAQLVRHLTHPNGWWRDTAQKLLVIRADTSVAPTLKSMALHHQSPLTRAHALWTLEGLGILDKELLVRKFRDTNSDVRIAALRISEQLVSAGDPSIGRHWRATLADATPDVAIQVLLSASYTAVPNADELLALAVERYGDNDAVKHLNRLHAERIAQARAEAERRKAMDRAQKELAAAIKRGEGHYKMLCFACHGHNGEGTAVPGGKPGERMAPTLINSPRVLGKKERLARILLHGLEGPIDGKDYTALMVPMASFGDEFIADVLTFLRTSWGHKASRIKPDEIAAIRVASEGRETPWTLAQLEQFDPPRLSQKKQWKVSANRNAGGARRAIDGNPGTRYETGTSMQPGMYYQIELPEPAQIFSLILESGGSPRDYPRGYAVAVSEDGKSWENIIARGEGRNPVTEIFFKPTMTRHIRITQTGSAPGLFWSIHELNIGGHFRKDLKKRAAAAPGKTVAASGFE